MHTMTIILYNHFMHIQIQNVLYLLYFIHYDYHKVLAFTSLCSYSYWNIVYY